MERWVGKVALITGASQGIGKAMAIKLVGEGIKVVGVARTLESLEALKKQYPGKFFACPGDVSKEEDILKAFKWTKQNVGPVSILINNAADVYARLYGKRLLDTETKDWKNGLDVNVLAPCITSREAVKHMKESNFDGQIININSIASHRVLYKVNLYSATKYGVKAFTETLRLDLASAGSKIKVTSVSPGAVKLEKWPQDFSKLLTQEENMLMKSSPMLDREDVANAVLYILSTPAHVNNLSPGRVNTELVDPNLNKNFSKQEAEIIKKMPKLQAEDIADAVIYTVYS